jgi:hypothetical protein
MSDIEKIAVFDDRIVQSQMKYAVSKGAASITSGTFSAIGANASQITFQVTSPSENIFIDKSFDVTSEIYFTVNITIGGTPPTVGDVIFKLGLDGASTQYPLNSLITTLTATINDATVSQNNNDTLTEILRMVDTPSNREMRTCPYMPDNYASYNSGYLTSNSPLNGYGSAYGSDYVPNGAYADLVFTDSAGAELVGNGTYNDGITAAVTYTDGVPRVTGAPVLTYNLFFKLTTTEKLILSPFAFADSENSTGLFSIQNISFIMNMQPPNLTQTSGRLLRHTTARNRTINTIGYNNAIGPFKNARIRCLFLTPSLSISLPPVSRVPMFEFPRYNTPVTLTGFTAGGTTSVESQTITLSNIPDYLIIYVKPLTYAATDGDYYFPITNINLNFDNYSGLMSSHSQQQLYRCSVQGGLHMDYQQWTGRGKISGNSGTTGGNVALTGGFLVLRPGIDFQLSTGLSVGLIGNYTLQFRLGLFNQTANTVTQANIWVIAASSGFFESKNGQSRIIKGASLTAEEVINAPMANAMTRNEVNRIIGGKFNFRNMMSSAVSNAPAAFNAFKQIAPIVKPFLPDNAKKGLTMIGMGSTGGARTGGNKSLSSRLM